VPGSVARVALLHERPHPLQEVLGAEQDQQLGQHVVGVRLEVLGEAVAVQALDRLDGQRRVARDPLRPGRRLRGELVVGHDPVHEAQLERALRREVLGEEADLARAGPADESRQEPGSAALGHDAATREAGEQLRPVAHQPDVAAQRQIQSVSRGGAVDGADHRRVDALQRHRGDLPGAEMGGRASGRERPGASDALARAGVLQVESAAEAPSCARHHDDANLGVVVRVDERLAERTQHLDADGIHPVRPVEGHRGHVTLLLVEQVRHAGILLDVSGSVAGGPGAYPLCGPPKIDNVK
jgi:hypothetical protein